MSPTHRVQYAGQQLEVMLSQQIQAMLHSRNAQLQRRGRFAVCEIVRKQLAAQLPLSPTWVNWHKLSISKL